MNDEKIKKLLGRRIRQLRKERGFTQDAASEKSGTISEKRWSDIERGIHAIGLTTLINIARGLKVPLRELFNYEEINIEKTKTSFQKNATLQLEGQITKIEKQIRTLKKTTRDLKNSID